MLFETSTELNTLQQANDSWYSKIEIYCWCFTNAVNKGSTNNVSYSSSACATLINVHPKELIKPEHYFDSSSNLQIVQAIKQLVFNSNKPDTDWKQQADSRFLILFKRNSSIADTVIYLSDQALLYNEKIMFHYPFNVMDSIRKILNKKEISCSSK